MQRLISFIKHVSLAGLTMPLFVFIVWAVVQSKKRRLREREDLKNTGESGRIRLSLHDYIPPVVLASFSFLFICSRIKKGKAKGKKNATLKLSAQLPRRPPPRSRMYTGASVLATQPGRRCLPLRNRSSYISLVFNSRFLDS
jgi:hypothetical protein